MQKPRPAKLGEHAHRTRAASISPDSLPVIGRYTAVVSLTLERSEVAVVDAPALESCRELLAVDPGFGSDWPADAIDLSAEKLLVARLKALFDFGAQISGITAEQLRTATYRRWPQVAAEQAKQAPGGGYERVKVDALIRSDGRGEWGFEHGDTARKALPVAGETVPGRPELDLYLQNVVRADLANRLFS